MDKKTPIIFFGLILLIGLILASPGLPHIFHGTVSYCDGFLGTNCDYDIPEGTEITATIGGDNLGVVGNVASDNQYGPLQIIPQGITGTIKFYIGGIGTEESIGYVAGQENVGDGEDFDLTLTEWTDNWAYCGDGYMNEGEQCDTDDFGEGYPTCENIMSLYYGQSGYTEGTLKCYDSNSSNPCTYDVSDCSVPEPVSSSSSSSSSSGSSGGGGGGGGSSSSSSSSSSSGETSFTSLSTQTTNETGSSSSDDDGEETIKVNETKPTSNSFFSFLTGGVTGVGDFAKSGLGITIIVLIVLAIGFIVVKKFR